jgi:probable DNA metabolism protein
MQFVSQYPQTLLYDGTIEGFLSAVFEATRLSLTVARIESKRRFVPDLFEEVRSIMTEPLQAERVWNGITKRGGLAVASMVRGALLSELPGMDTTIWHYLRKLFADPSGAYARNMLDEHAYAVYATARKVMGELHRFHGLVRFQKSQQGLMFAVIDPTYNIVELLTAHFVSRYPNMPWMIADSARGTGIHYDGKEVQLLECNPANLPSHQEQVRDLLNSTEQDYQDLWRVYYDSINISERKNTSLMVRMLPRKYWKYLPEKNRPLSHT